MYVNVEIYNVEQRQINVVYFNVDINSVRQRRNNVVIFNVKFHNVDQCQNNVFNMTICKKVEKSKKIFLSLEKSSVKKSVFKNFASFTGKNLCCSVRPATLLKRDSITSVSLGNLRNLLENNFWQNTSSGCFWI